MESWSEVSRGGGGGGGGWGGGFQGKYQNHAFAF